MNHEKKQRCVNIDWLEVYVLESNDRYPCDAEYYRRNGYLVHEREYGTRVYKQMFEIVDSMGNPLLEIRREPASGEADFNGLLPQSSHIRLPNWMLYQGNPVQFLRDFLLTHDYIFKRIYRIDICYDFEYFDSGDRPDRFARRYLEGKFRKINQCSLAAHGEDHWNDCKWNSLSWGSRTSMVSTKLYNKSLELKESKHDKPYIKTAWMLAGLIDNPTSMTKMDMKGNLYTPEIWRVEFSMKSSADGWLIIENQRGKKMKKTRIPHKLSLFDSKDKLWSRFQDLAYHYFNFKYREFLGAPRGVTEFSLSKVDSGEDRPLKRKDRCRDKVLFHWDEDHVFTQLACAPAPSKRNNDDEILKRRLQVYRLTHPQPNIRAACDEILKNIQSFDVLRYVPMGDNLEVEALKIALRRRINGDEMSVVEIIEEVKEILASDKVF